MVLTAAKPVNLGALPGIQLISNLAGITRGSDGLGRKKLLRHLANLNRLIIKGHLCSVGAAVQHIIIEIAHSGERLKQ